TAETAEHNWRRRRACPGGIECPHPALPRLRGGREGGQIIGVADTSPATTREARLKASTPSGVRSKKSDHRGLSESNDWGKPVKRRTGRSATWLTIRETPRLGSSISRVVNAS